MKKDKGLTLLDFKTFYKVEVTKAVWYKHRHIDRGSRTQKLELNIHGHLTIDKEAKKIHRERRVFSTNDARNTRYPGTKKGTWSPTSHHL